MDAVTEHKVRVVVPEDLGMATPVVSPEDKSTLIVPEENMEDTDVQPIDEDDQRLKDVQDALAMGFAGAIFVGPPGTGKSYYAKRIAAFIAGGFSNAVRFVQFHASYQYEDFMEGFVPGKDGFVRQLRTFPLLCQEAADSPAITHVLVIDEISRVDAARVFGEALTYIETDKRGQEFTLASGSTLTIPSNIVILATMNPWDKGVDEVDVALERRFAHIDMPPDRKELDRLLVERGAEAAFITQVLAFFDFVQKIPDEPCHLGHAYFLTCTDASKAALAWKFRLGPFFARACRLDRDQYAEIEKRWNELVTPPAQVVEPAAEPAPEGPQA